MAELPPERGRAERPAPWLPLLFLREREPLMSEDTSPDPSPDQQPPAAAENLQPAATRGGMPAPGRWAVALLIGTVLASVLMNVAPQPFAISEELAAVGVGSPLEKQIEAQQAGLRVRRQNASIGYALAGGALGLCSLFVVSWRRPGQATSTVAASVVGGALLGVEIGRAHV